MPQEPPHPSRGKVPPPPVRGPSCTPCMQSLRPKLTARPHLRCSSRQIPAPLTPDLQLLVKSGEATAAQARAMMSPTANANEVRGREGYGASAMMHPIVTAPNRPTAFIRYSLHQIPAPLTRDLQLLVESGEATNAQARAMMSTADKVRLVEKDSDLRAIHPLYVFVSPYDPLVFIYVVHCNRSRPRSPRTCSC